jgi:hypothetical protein
MSEKLNLFPFIQSAGTLEQARLFLKSRNLPFSAGSWKQMVETRLQRNLDDGKLSEADIASFLGTVEEHGRQHVFLYKSAHVDHLFSMASLRRLLAKSSQLPSLNEPRVAELPELPVISEIREDRRGKERAIVAKVVETRYRRINRREEEKHNVSISVEK